MRAAVDLVRNLICKPILLGSQKIIEEKAKELNLDLNGIQVIGYDSIGENKLKKEELNYYAKLLYDKMNRHGISYHDAQ